MIIRFGRFIGTSFPPQYVFYASNGCIQPLKVCELHNHIVTTFSSLFSIDQLSHKKKNNK